MANELFLEEQLTRLRKLASKVDIAETDLTKARAELRAAVAAANEADVSLAAIGRSSGSAGSAWPRSSGGS
jgi:outer membrane murein-binding lipoprotein Lpp